MGDPLDVARMRGLFPGQLFDALGVTEAGGAVRLGVVHHNTAEEVDRAVQAIAALGRLR